MVDSEIMLFESEHTEMCGYHTKIQQNEEEEQFQRHKAFQIVGPYFSMVNCLWRYYSQHLEYTIKREEYKGKKLCVIVDVDGTIISTHPSLQNVIFKDALNFLHAMKRLNVDVFIITAREDLNAVYSLFAENDLTRSNVDNLIKRIFVCPPVELKYSQRRRSSIFILQNEVIVPTRVKWCIEKKQEQRNEIRSMGYTIACCIGDAITDLSWKDDNEQWSPTQNFLVPDPF